MLATHQTKTVSMERAVHVQQFLVQHFQYHSELVPPACVKTLRQLVQIFYGTMSDRRKNNTNLFQLTNCLSHNSAAYRIKQEGSGGVYIFHFSPAFPAQKGNPTS